MSVNFTTVSPRVGSIARRIEAEFREMPGLRLTAPQVRRLWSLSQQDTEAALDFLSETGALIRDANGSYLQPRRRFVNGPR
jgi:hypothetical protein